MDYHFRLCDINNTKREISSSILSLWRRRLLIYISALQRFAHNSIRFVLETPRKNNFMKTAVIGIGCALWIPSVEGVPLYVTRIPNGENVPGVKALGHEDTTGDESIRNVFGIAFEEAGTEWTKELCEADSDEDGQTNGQELGDPCCIWAEGDTPQWTSGVSHPGDASKQSDESLWSSLDCDAVRAKAEADAEAEADDEASKNSPDESEDSEVDISMGDASTASVVNSAIATAMLLAAVLQLVW